VSDASASTWAGTSLCVCHVLSDVLSDGCAGWQVGLQRWAIMNRQTIERSLHSQHTKREEREHCAVEGHVMCWA
jgi:hypothetical protein